MSAPRPVICPLQDGKPCQGSDCAWWNFIDEECSVKTLGTLATIDIGGRERKHD
ncbi:hypothetical protein ES703_103053 [subsurface metagenome]